MGNETRPLVGIVMGSASDVERMRKACDALQRFGIGYEFRILSAHRVPDQAAAFAKGARERGVRVLIAGAGWAAHLAGAMAAHSTLPVIGVPLSGSALGGEDALFATVQMPKGVPVATVAIDCAYNAGVLAAQILGANDEAIAEDLLAYKREQEEAIDKANEELQLP